MAERRTRPSAREIKDAYEYLFNSSLSKIRDATLGGRLFHSADDALGVAGRSLAWKLFLVQAEPLQMPADAVATPPLAALRASRVEYAKLLLEKMRAPDGSYEDGLIIPGTNSSPPRVEQSKQNLDRNNPLSLHNENPWTQWFASMELRKTILQDVERTFPDIGYFRDAEVQAQLTNILFVYSAMHPDIGYRQGMHELLAPLYYAVDFDSIPDGDDNSHLADSAVREYCSRVWVGADAWTLFAALMRGVGRWYEWQESKSPTASSPLASHVQLSVATDGVVKPFVAPIVESCNRMQSTYLKAVDSALWKSMQKAGIEPQIYGIRWLRLLFTREFSMHDAMILWDGLFACDPTFDLAQWVCVAMLLRIRNQLMHSDYSEQLTYLLRYPSAPEPSEPSGVHHTTLLLRQALALQMSPSAAMGVSIVHENRNLLDIPVEVPEPPPPPARRRAGPGGRGQSFSSSEYTPNAGPSRQGPSLHTRQQSTPMGLPELFARGLLERGESLGINKTVMNAVSELKRNLPDIATSLTTRLPMTPPTSYAAYPLVDERSQTERPAWESRFEVEREVSQMRALQRQLGDSVAWIVDTLLQDEGGEADAQSIRLRKREALECLSYARDVLKGTVTQVEAERLIGEEEFKRRKQRVEQVDANRPAKSRPAALPPAEIRPQPAGLRNSGDYINSPRPTARSPPRASPLGTLSSAVRSTPSLPSPSSASSVAPYLTPKSPNVVPLAPWNYTKSNFSSSDPPIANLPRPPPRSSTGMHSTQAAPPPHMPSSSLPSSHLSRDPSTRPRVQDPLGALP